MKEGVSMISDNHGYEVTQTSGSLPYLSQLFNSLHIKSELSTRIHQASELQGKNASDSQERKLIDCLCFLIIVVSAYTPS